MESIRQYQTIVEAGSPETTKLKWMVVESIPVHEDIKLAKPGQSTIHRRLDTVNGEPCLMWHKDHLLQFHAGDRLNSNRSKTQTLKWCLFTAIRSEKICRI